MRVASRVGHDKKSLATCAQSRDPIGDAGDCRFTDIQNPKGVEKKYIELICDSVEIFDKARSPCPLRRRQRRTYCLIGLKRLFGCQMIAFRTFADTHSLTITVRRMRMRMTVT